ncbi:MAG: ROK family protein [Clostridia bacterium]|nr:ROK family protein [Clostridia bacterium]
MLQFGFDIGGTNIAGGIVDDDANILVKAERRFPKGEGVVAVLNVLQDMFLGLCRELRISKYLIAAVGAAIPGSITFDGASVIDAHNLDFHNVPFKAMLRQRIDTPVYLQNDANAATLAELVSGSLKGCKTAALLTLGTGVGGGLIINGRLFNGGRNMGVELGHMLLKSGGEPCTCGNLGCVESYCSASSLCREYGTDSAKRVFEAAEAGDKRAQTVLDRYIDDLGSAIASIVNLIDPERIALGGGVSHAGDRLLAPLSENVKKKCFFPSCPPIVRAHHGNDAGIIGAAMAHQYQ